MPAYAAAMIDRNLPARTDRETSEPYDLPERLANYRSRVEREGRNTAVKRLDREIDEARRGPRQP